MTVLTAIDVQAIQAYVFASDRLRDVVGGSRLLDAALDRSALSALAGRHGGSVVFAGGGNALLRFDGDGDGGHDRETIRARAFAAELSEDVLRRDPTLALAFAHQAVGRNPVADHRDLMAGLARNKRQQVASPPDLGLGVTERCAYTGGVATAWLDTAEGRRPVSSTIVARRDHLTPSPEMTLRDVGTSGPDAICYFPDQLDQLAEDDGNELAVVHIDGNSMGASLARALDGAASLDELLDRLESASREIRTALEEAEQAVVDAVCRHIRRTPEGDLVLRSPRNGAIIRLRRDATGSGGRDRVALPIRPVLRAGDDLTFVCDGRLGLSLARIALTHLDQRVLTHLSNRRFHAAAGVAITKRGAPFDRAYLLAETCCREAKAHVRLHDPESAELSAIDWHIGSVGDDIDTHRRTHLTLRTASRAWRLTARPYALEGDPTLGELRGAHTLTALDDEILRDLTGPRWSGRHGRLHRLAEAIRRSDAEARTLVDRWRFDDPPAWLTAAGFDGATGDNVLLDALELLDHHLALEP